MKRSRFLKLADEWVAQQPNDGPTSDDVIRAVAQLNANVKLRAYRIDRNPDHIFDAYAALRKGRAPITEVMLRNLDKALAERHKKPSGKPKQQTLRDVHIAMTLARQYGGAIPPKLDGKLIADLAKQHKATSAAIKKAISRIRKAIANPDYERARAFR